MLLADSVPPYTWVSPVYVLAPESVTNPLLLPERPAITLPPPEITPLAVMLPVLLLFSQK